MNRMDRMKKILAWVGIIVLVALYLVTFILGVFGSPRTKDLFMGCVVCTVVVPVLIYAMMLVAKRLEWNDEDVNGDGTHDAEGKGDGK